MTENKVVIISGPTGVGENAIVEEIKKRYSNFVRLVTATTRKPRLNEKNMVDYYFFSNDEFLEEVEKGNIPEYQNSRDEDVYYGTYLPELESKLNERLNVIVTTDITGTKYFKKNHKATTIFILPDSMKNLRKRHLKRDPDVSVERLEKRLEYAQYEIDNEKSFYDYEVVNAQDQLSKTVDDIIEILKKENYKIEKRN
ncbi:MAG: hypothetical protein U9O20_02320 [Patescibacteria group bacterium]|nr:hypothetical protein [Patescibacteria group bacterium]